MTVMYIMTVSTLDFEESLTVVQFCREMANPNFGFRQQLRAYSETKLPEVRALTVEVVPKGDCHLSCCLCYIASYVVI